MATSQNGWTALPSARYSGPLPRLRRWFIPGTNVSLPLRDGSAGFTLVHAILWWHEKVEPIDQGIPDDWGYAPRPIRGYMTGLSNHASATAADVNATRHPLGVPTFRTFTARQVAKLRARMTWHLYRGVIRWGGDYRSRPDAMHLELVKPLGEVEKVARRLMRTPRGKRILAANPGAREVILS